MPGLLARIFFIQFQIKNQIQKHLSFDRYCSTSLSKVSVHQSGFAHYLSLLLLAFFSLVMIVLVTVVQKGTVGDFRSRAWSGITANVQLLQGRLGLIPSPVTLLPKEAKSQALFRKLTKTYPKAELQVIDLPALSIQGQAFLHYDPLIDRTFVFTRIENLPKLEKRIVRLWLTDSSAYVPVGISEFVREENRAVAYSVFVKDGNIKSQFTQLEFSYDLSVRETAPTASFLNLRF